MEFEPSFMDTQMVERIPKPPKIDIINSARGKKTEGYKHQLYFHYPKKMEFKHFSMLIIIASIKEKQKYYWEKNFSVSSKNKRQLLKPQNI